MFPDTLTDSLSDEVLRQATGLEAEERYALFLTYTKKAKQVWLLKGSEGFVMMADSDAERLPVFPHRDLASAWRDEMIKREALPAGTELDTVAMDTFVTTWLPGLEKNDMSLVIYPAGIDSDDQVVTAADLRDDLSAND